jgi:lipopolysaccharide transport system permease protein
VHFLLSLPILFVLLLGSDVSLSGAVALLPLLIAIEFVLIAGLAYPVAILSVWFRDTQHVLRIALQLLFYLTPIFYQASSAPDGMRLLLNINPLAHLVDAYRAVLMRGTAPGLGSLSYLLALSIVLLIIGLAWFRRARGRFADEL